MQPPLVYERDAYTRTLDTTILESGLDGKRPFVVLADTVFYPEGGGQPADHGEISGVFVTDVQKKAGTIRHYLVSPLSPGPVSAVLDWKRRFDHMQQHTGQHLLTAVAQDRFGFRTTAFHLGETTCDIELDLASMSVEKLEELEDAVALEIRASRTVSSKLVLPEEFSTLAVRTRGLPDGHEGPVRLVEIDQVDLNTCGGTHLRSTSEIELVKLLGTESIRGGTRLFFVAGTRARRRFSAHERRNAELRELLGTSDAGLSRAASQRIEDNKQLNRTVRILEEELVERWLDVLEGRLDPVVHLHFEGKDAGFLQRTGKAATARLKEKALLVTSTDGAQDAFVLAFGEALTGNFPEIAKAAAALLEGRGGGSGRVFQGKAASLKAVPQVLKRVHESLPSFVKGAGGS